VAIVTSTYRYKRPPRKRKPVEIEVPAIVTIDPKTRVAGKPKPAPDAPTPANDDGKPPPPAARKSAIITVPDRKTVHRQMAKLMQGDEPRRSAIVTARKPGKAIPDGWLPDTPEEHKRRGDLADAMFQDMKREIAEGR